MPVDPEKLKRRKAEETEENPPEEQKEVSGGPIDRVVDFAFNPSREKIREVTIVDRYQGKFLPMLDIIDDVWQYSIEIAAYRQDNVEYEKQFHRKRPIPPTVLQNFIYRTAQWQKSIAGKNLERAIDIALAEKEAGPEPPGALDGSREY